MQINSAKDLDVYKKAYALSMEIFHLSKSWPVEEKHAELTAVLNEVGRMLGSMLRNPTPFLLKTKYDKGSKN